MISNTLLTLSLRFFLFDFVLFRPVRDRLNTQGYILHKLFHCPFCQGFWTGLGVYVCTHSKDLAFTVQYGSSWLTFGFITAYLSLMTTAIFYPLIEKFENHNDGVPLL